MIFAYDCRVGLAYVLTFDHPHLHNFHNDIHTCGMDVVGLTYTTQSDMKSGCMLVLHDSCKQKLYHLDQP